MTQSDFRPSLLAAQEKGRAAMQAVAENHLPLVAAMVRRFSSGLYEREELYQQGCIGLMKALARYRPEWGVAFATYAVPLILGEMRNLPRQNAPIHISRTHQEQQRRLRRAMETMTNTLHREPTVPELASALRMDAAELVLLMEDITVTSTDAETENGTPLSETLPDPEDWLARVEMRDLISRLPEGDQRLLHLRYIEGLSQREAGMRLGLTQVQVSRREKIIRALLRQALAD